MTSPLIPINMETECQLIQLYSKSWFSFIWNYTFFISKNYLVSVSLLDSYNKHVFLLTVKEWLANFKYKTTWVNIAQNKYKKLLRYTYTVIYRGNEYIDCE